MGILVVVKVLARIQISFIQPSQDSKTTRATQSRKYSARYICEEGIPGVAFYKFMWVSIHFVI